MFLIIGPSGGITGITSPPSLPAHGVPAFYGQPGQTVNQGIQQFFDGIDTVKCCVWNTAGTGALTITPTIWGFAPEMQIAGVGQWFVLKKLNGGVAIPTNATDKVRYSEDIAGVAGFTRFAVESTAALGGAGGSFLVALKANLS